MMGLPCGEEIMIVRRTMWTQSTSVTDRRTDGRTDGRTDRITITDTVQTVSHDKNYNSQSVADPGFARGTMASAEHKSIMWSGAEPRAPKNESFLSIFIQNRGQKLKI